MSDLVFNAITNAQDIKNMLAQLEVNDQNNLFASSYWFHNLIDDNYISYTATDEDGKIQCALHVCTHKKLNFKIAEIAGEPYSQYSDAINNGDQPVDAFLAQAFEHLYAQGVDAIHLRNVRADAHIYDYCQNNGVILEEKQAPWIELDNYADHAAFVKAAGKNVPRVYRKLFREFEVKYECFVDEQVSSDLVRQVIKLKMQQLDIHGQTSRVFASHDKIEKLVEILSTPSPDLKTIIATITCDGVLASASISHAKADTHYGYILAMNADYTRHSPGNAQVIKNVEWAMENNITKFDFLPPADSYKFKWTKNNYTAAYDILLPMTAKGKMYGSIYLKFLRPKLRDLYLAVKNSSLFKALKK